MAAVAGQLQANCEYSAGQLYMSLEVQGRNVSFLFYAYVALHEVFILLLMKC